MIEKGKIMQGSHTDTFVKRPKSQRRFDDGTKEKNGNNHGKFDYHKQQRRKNQNKEQTGY